METKRECLSSWYGTYYVICLICKEKAGYHHRFDSGINEVFKCKCGKGLRQIKKESK